MAPLILHNVPDDERYVGDDGVIRPYAMVFPHQDGAPPNQRPRRTVAEKGSFGKSTRRSRSKTATPARREDPTIAAADALFETWKTEQLADDGSKSTAATPQRKPSMLASQPKLSSNLDDAPASSPVRVVHKEPTEMILRGYRSYQQQYAAINHYEQLAGRICEDYSRDPPIENRRYKSELRDPAFTRSQPLTPEERAKVNRPDGGEHWVKVTFESAQAADAATYASPQRVNGHFVYAEPYHGIPPARDEAVPDPVVGVERPWPISRDHTPEPFSAFSRAAGREASVDVGSDLDEQRLPSPEPRRGRSANSDPYRWANNGSGSNLEVDGSGQSSMRERGGKRRQAQAPRQTHHAHGLDVSPPHSNTSSRTMDTGTIATNSTTTATSETMAGGTPTTPARQQQQQQPPAAAAATASPAENSIFCRSVPGVRKATLLSAEQALLPRPSYTQRVVLMIPFLSWFSGSMIGNEVPRTDTGEFDWNKASLYWKVIWWLDFTFKLFGGEILNTDKED